MYYLEVFFETGESIAIKSMVEKPTVEELTLFLKKDIPHYGWPARSSVISYSDVESFFDTNDIDKWPILSRDEEVPIRGARITQNHSNTGEKIQYGMDIRMEDDKYYGGAYFLTPMGKAHIGGSWEYKSFSEAYDDLSRIIAKHMIENPVIVLG